MANTNEEFAMDIDHYYRFAKWTAYICFFIMFPPLAIILVLAILMFMMGGK